MRYIHAKSLASRCIWISNWMRILPYLAANARLVNNKAFSGTKGNTFVLQGVGMSNSHKHLTIQERAVVMTMRYDPCSIRSIAKRPCRSANTIGRELKRSGGRLLGDAGTGYRGPCCHRRGWPGAAACIAQATAQPA